MENMITKFWRILFFVTAIIFISNLFLVKVGGVVDNNDIAFMIYGVGLMVISKTCHDWRI